MLIAQPHCGQGDTPDIGAVVTARRTESTDSKCLFDWRTEMGKNSSSLLRKTASCLGLISLPRPVQLRNHSLALSLCSLLVHGYCTLITASGPQGSAWG